MTGSRTILFASLICVFLSGCVATNKEEKADPKVELEKAAQVNLELGMAYMQKNDNERALSKLEKAIKLKPQFADAHNAIAILYARLGEDQLARQHYEKAIHLDPNDSRALNNYGQFLCSRGQRQDAESMFQRAINNPLYNSPEIAYLNAGLCAKDAGDLEQAEIQFRGALQKQSKMGLALYQMADLNFQRGDYPSTQAYLQRYSEVSNETAASLWLAIRTARAVGDRDQEASYALRLKNNFPDSQETGLLQRMDNQ